MFSPLPFAQGSPSSLCSSPVTSSIWHSETHHSETHYSETHYSETHYTHLNTLWRKITEQCKICHCMLTGRKYTKKRANEYWFLSWMDDCTGVKIKHAALHLPNFLYLHQKLHQRHLKIFIVKWAGFFFFFFLTAKMPM